MPQELSASNFPTTATEPRPYGLLNAVTVDAEEWNDTVLFNGAPGGGNFARNTAAVLALLAARAVKATFFVLGDLALRYPAEIARIAAAGHEVASHGHTHKSLWRMSRREFALDLKKSREAILQAAGAAPAGYRSPTWSLKGKEKEFLPVIRDAGFSYDSSLYPAGFGAAPRSPWEILPGLTEVPPSVFKFAGFGLPFLGGTFLRWAGAGFLARQVKKLNSAGLPAVLYFHTWEFDREPPRPVPFLTRLIQYHNVKSVPPKIGALLGDFNWAPIRDMLKTAPPRP